MSATQLIPSPRELPSNQLSLLTEYEQTDLRELVGHTHAVQARDLVSRAYDLFERYDVEFLGVLEGDKAIGMCSRERLGILLSQRFGRALYLRQTVGDALRQTVTCAYLNDPISMVLEKAFYRKDESFFHDVLLIAEDGQYLGMIPMPRLVRLQHGHFVNHIEVLKRQRHELNTKNALVEQELALARDMQHSMLPGPQSNTGPCGTTLSYCFRYQPTTSLSGDFIQLLDCGDDALGVLICDVMGHGIRSALITAMIRAVVERASDNHPDPGKLLTQLNDDLFDTLQRNGNCMFLTACCLVVDRGRGEVRYGRAGHHLPLHVPRGQRVRPLGESSEPEPAIGLIPASTYTTHYSALSPGDLYLLYTDGLFEAADADGKEFGEARLIDVVERWRGGDCEQLLDAMVHAVCQYSGCDVLEDDLCLVGIDYRNTHSQLIS